MDFALSSEQLQIKDSVDRFVAENYSFDQRIARAATADGFSRKSWRAFAELGWLGIAFPEAVNGFGGSPVETMILMEAFGLGLVLEPFVPTIVLGGTALLLGDTPTSRHLLANVIAGETLLALAYAEAAARYEPRFVETRARRDGAEIVVSGQKRAVLYAAAADTFVVSVRTSGAVDEASGISLVLVAGDAPGVTRRDYTTIDGGRASDVTFENVRVTSENVLGDIDGGLPLLERVLDTGIGAVCAEAVGAMSVMVRATVDHLKTREQFGVPIGSFQVLQHRAVDMLMESEFARSMVHYGTMALASDSPDTDRRRALSATKVQTARSSRFVAQAAIQLHGGIGLSEEFMIGHYFKRLTAIELSFGDVDFHLRRYITSNSGALRSSAVGKAVPA